MAHYPVLLKEVLQYAGADTGHDFIDATAGGGGHIRALLKQNPKARILGLDLDADTLKELENSLKEDQLLDKVVLVHSNYLNVDRVAKEKGFEKVSGIILDLGFSSLQLDETARGFSFQRSGPLDMRYNRQQNLTAAKVVNKYSEQKLTEIFKKYGEEPFSKKIARNIVLRRKISPISVTDEVFGLIRQSLPGHLKHKASDAARRIFQAIRIEVNSELENLEQALPKMVELLEPGGRLVVISFHSLEDRIVKNYFNLLAKGCICPPDFPQCVCGKNPEAKVLTKKPVTASEEEAAENPRSKPAKLRAISKL
jgi:16S rRNA (cytosine1402-N4)-methyltransferase